MSNREGRSRKNRSTRNVAGSGSEPNLNFPPGFEQQGYVPQMPWQSQAQPQPQYQAQFQQMPFNQTPQFYPSPQYSDPNSPHLHPFLYAQTTSATASPSPVNLQSQYRDLSSEESSDENQVQLSDEEADDVIPETQPTFETPPTSHARASKTKPFTQRSKSKRWSEAEEVALVKAYIHISEDDARGNQQRAEAFWHRVLNHFAELVRGTDRTVHQVNSKWKDLQKKVNYYNTIFNKKTNARASGQSDADVERAAKLEYRKLYNKSTFAHESSWMILRHHPKWLNVTLMNDHSQPNSSKRTKTSSSNTYTTSSDARFSTDLNNTADAEFEVQQTADVVVEQVRKRKGKRAQTSEDPELLAIRNQIQGLQSSFDEDKASRERYRADKLRILQEERKQKEAILKNEAELSRVKRFEKDLKFFNHPHSHLRGRQQQDMLNIKREIAERYGWDLPEE